MAAIPHYANVVLVGTSWTKIYPLASGDTITPQLGVLLSVADTYGGSANSKTADFSHAGANPGMPIPFGTPGEIQPVLIRKEVLQQVNSEIWVKGSASDTPVSIQIQ